MAVDVISYWKIILKNHIEKEFIWIAPYMSKYWDG